MALFGKPDTDKMRSQKDVKGLINALKYRSDHDVRYNAAKALGEMGNPIAFEPLVKAFQTEKDDFAKIGIIMGLAAFGKPAVDVLVAALKDYKFAYFRDDIAEALGQINDARALDPLINTLQLDKYPSSKMIEALATFGEPAISVIVGLMTHENLTVKGSAKNALKKIGPPAVKYLAAALGQGNWSLRYDIISLFGDIGSPEVIDPLRKALNDKDMHPFAIIALNRINDILPVGLQQMVAHAEEEQIEERIKSFPESWQNHPAKRAQLISIITSPSNIFAVNCPYYFLAVCRMRLISRNDASTGPEKCSLQTGTHTNCFVWQIDPRPGF